jgi:hypothetical protein
LFELASECFVGFEELANRTQTLDDSVGILIISCSLDLFLSLHRLEHLNLLNCHLKFSLQYFLIFSKLFDLSSLDIDVDLGIVLDHSGRNRVLQGG